MILLVFFLIFAGLGFIAGLWCCLWLTSPEHMRAVQDKKFARKYDLH